MSKSNTVLQLGYTYSLYELILMNIQHSEKAKFVKIKILFLFI